MSLKSLYLRKYLGFLALSFCFQFLPTTTEAQMRHIFLDASDSTDQLYKLGFFSASQGFVAFQDWIGYTTDSGRTFTQLPIKASNVNYNGYSVNLTFGFQTLGVKAFDQNTVICYGDYGLVPAILYSTNGGTSYTLNFLSQYNPNQLSTGITDMIFPQNDNTGFAIDADRILKTTDRGVTWTVIATYPGSFFDYLEAVDDNHVYAISLGSHTNKVLATTNSGTSWQQLVLPSGSLNYANFVSANNGWLDLTDNNGNGDVYYTSDGGANWTQKNNSLATPFTCRKMKFVNDTVGYATGNVYQVYKTMDSGKVWEPLPRDNSFTYYGFSFNDLQYYALTNQLWAGGAHGFLELGTAGGGTPLPTAYFLIDTAGLSASGTVLLNNYSRPNYTFRWLRNDTLFSTAYNASYAHAANRLRDTIMLIVSNGTQTDTLVQIQYFYPAVSISSFSPTTGAQGTVVTINGSHFTGATSVSFGGVPASAFTVVSDGVIQATVGSGASGNIIVGTATGVGQIGGFVFVMAPVITSFSPQTGTAGTTVTILGSHLTGTTQVLFGGLPATSFTVVSGGEITAVVPSGSTGSVEVVNAGGASTLAGWVELPAVSVFTPVAGSNGVQVVITGTGFTSVSTISFGGVPARSYTVNSSTSISAIVGAGSTGNIVVTTTSGSASLPGFTYVQGPQGVTISPMSGPAGTTVTISGTNFSPTAAANTVWIGSGKASVLAASPTSLTVKAPTSATYQPVTVTTNGVTAFSPNAFLTTFPGGGSLTANSFAPDVDYEFNVQLGLTDQVVIDIDGDGKPDIVQTSPISQGLDIAINTSSPGNISFNLQLSYLSNYPMTEIKLADVDGDGLPELLTVVNDSIYVFRNLSTPGNIVFGPPTKIAGSSGVAATEGVGTFQVGDLDGDGRPDLVVTTGYYPPYEFIFLNTGSPGSISFANPIPFNLPTGYLADARALIFADLNGDGKQDLVIEHAVDDTLAILTNNSTPGNVNFSATATLQVTEPGQIFIGDVDGDGKPDLSIPDGVNTVSIFRNTTTSAISFAPRVDLPAWINPAQLVAADMDGDGKPDLVVTNTGDSTVSVLKNESTPGNLAFAPYINYSTGYRGLGADALALVDFDGDGKTDICVINELLHVLRNTVTAQPFIKSFSPTIGVSGTAVTIKGANFSGATAVSFGGVAATSFTVQSDSLITAVVGAGAMGSVVVTNSFGSYTAKGFAYGYPPVITSVAPLSGAVGTAVTITGNNFSSVPGNNVVFFGQMQVPVTAARATSLTVTVPNGTTYGPITVTTGQRTAYFTLPFVQTFAGGGASFQARTFVASPTQPVTTYGRGLLADIDGDGKLDIVMGDFLEVLRNTSVPGKMSFTNPVSFGANYSPDFAVGDIDGDGKPDIVSGNSTNTFSFYKNLSTPGVISFSAKQDFTTGDANSQPGGVVIADIDKDGKPDVITISYQEATMTLFRNISSNGQVAFDVPIVYALPTYPFDIKAGDLDGDGNLDLAVSNGNGASVFRNTSIPGSISFAPRLDVFAGSDWPISLALGDIDGDGKPDLVITNENSSSVTVSRNTSQLGTLSFSTAVSYATNGGADEGMVADLDGDGNVDLATSNMSVLKNISVPGSLSMRPQVSYANPGPLGGAIADVDGDGRPDIAVWSTDAVIIYRNETGAPAPSFTPAVALAGQTITIAGGGLGPASGVRFGNVPAQTFQVSSDTGMTAVVGSGGSGNVVIYVDGDSVVMPGFVYLSTPKMTSSGGAAICTGSTDTLISSATSYNQWYKDGVLLPNDTSSRLVVTDGGVYSVVETLDGVMAPSSASYTLTLIPIPPAPVITQDSITLISSADSGNQWYADTTILLQGATGKEFTPGLKGYYSVKVTQNGCTSPISSMFEYIPPTPPPPPAPPPSGNSVTADTVQIVPNPFRTFITIHFNKSSPLTVVVTDIMGRSILVDFNVLDGAQINLASLAPGIYFIKITGDNGLVNIIREIWKI